MGNRWPYCSFSDCGESKACISGWQQGCTEDTPSSHFFKDDDILLDRLEAASDGDRLLTKLHVNVALFSTTSCDIVEGLLQLSHQNQVWRCGDRLSLHQSLQNSLRQHARPPVYCMKSLRWVYRLDEIPSPAADTSRQCVLLFFSTTLTAAAALKWHNAPPDIWKRKGIQPLDALRSVDARLSDVISALRFLACIALLQHCAQHSLLENSKIISALAQATGIDSGGVQKQQDFLLPSSPVTKADISWDVFFREAPRRPSDATAALLRDLQTAISEDNSPVRSMGSGPQQFAMPMGLPPLVTQDIWDDELVAGPDIVQASEETMIESMMEKRDPIGM